MTIGIAARGPNAGLAVFRALRAVERVAWGAIGGFATYAAIGGDGVLHRYETQRGGASTLFTDGEATGTEPPVAVAAAPSAGVMSSGPDRPEPLSQFVVADPQAGLVTGHRLVNGSGLSGRPINAEILDCMAKGRSAKEAVDRLLDENPESDAGAIAVDREGHIYARNSDRVLRRPDLGHARRENGRAGAVVEVLHNAIFPGPSIATLAAEIALEAMVPASRIDDWVTVPAGIPLEPGPENMVVVDDTGVAQKVVTTDSRILTGRHNCAAIYLGSSVRRGTRVLGTTAFEPNVVVEDGRIVTMSGQTRMRLGYRYS